MVFQRMFGSLFSPPQGKLMVRSAILWGLGDVGAQAVTHYSAQAKDKGEEPISFGIKGEESKIDWYRVFSTSLFGGFSFGSCIGPLEYYRFSRILRRSMATADEALGKAVVDGVFGTLEVATFFPVMGFAHGRTRSVEQAKEDVKRGFRPALVLGGAVMPAVYLANWRFVPRPYQLHCASLFALVGSGSLSWIELQQQRARKIQMKSKV